MNSSIEKYTGLISRKIPEKYCYTLFYIISVILFSISWINQLFIGPNSFKITVSVGVLLTLLMLIFVPQADTKSKFKLNRLYFVIMLIIGISFLGNGLYFRVVGYMAIGIVFIFVVN